MPSTMTREVFWETWPKVALRFSVDPRTNHLRAEDGSCPIVAVGEFLSETRGVSRTDYSLYVLADQWAYDIVDAADVHFGNLPEKVRRRINGVRRRLLSFIHKEAMT